MEDSDLGLNDVFTRSPSPPPPEPTYAQYNRPLPESRQHKSEYNSLSIRLVGSHPLWGHHLWNAARSFASYLDHNAGELCDDKTVLELGAGGGLPGLVASLNGARKVLLTDYPDSELLENLRINVEQNIPNAMRGAVQVQGHIWGRSVTHLLKGSGTSEDKFDLILMSDLIFNHSQHDALLDTAESCLVQNIPSTGSISTSKTPCILAFYTHHRPHLAERDLEFFSKAKERGWSCEKIVTEHFKPMFPEDTGDEIVRSVVHGWRLTR